jgi:acetyltransferase-like isoleucine patch superfamily enzyme
MIAINKVLGRIWREFNSPMARAYLAMRGVVVGRALQMVYCPICRRHSMARIVIGSHVTIRNRLSENLAGIQHRTVLVANRAGAFLSIGDHVGISGAVIFCEMEIVIENYVNIGAGAKIYDTDFHPLGALARRRHDQSEIKRAPVRICQDAWIGAEAVILKGVTVGARAVIGARSVVTKDVPPDTIVAGCPARIVGSVTESCVASC